MSQVRLSTLILVAVLGASAIFIFFIGTWNRPAGVESAIDPVTSIETDAQSRNTAPGEADVREASKGKPEDVPESVSNTVDSEGGLTEKQVFESLTPSEQDEVARNELKRFAEGIRDFKAPQILGDSPRVISADPNE